MAYRVQELSFVLSISSKFTVLSISISAYGKCCNLSTEKIVFESISAVFYTPTETITLEPLQLDVPYIMVFSAFGKKSNS